MLMVLVKEMRMLFLTLATMVVSVAVVMNAYTKKHQFYPTMIYLTKSSRTMSVSQGGVVSVVEL